MSSTLVITEHNLEHYFDELVNEASESLKLELQDAMRHYLAHLLSQFQHTQQIKSEEPLAFLYQRALTSEPHDRINLLKQLGDFTLYMAGFFSDSLSRKTIDVDYYISMGENAYGHLSDLVKRTYREHMRQLFADLANNFVQAVDVLAEVSDKTRLDSTNKDLLRLYEKWLKTGSERTERILKEQGIVPNSKINTEFIQ